jgi:hypothetical protein
MPNSRVEETTIKRLLKSPSPPIRSFEQKAALFSDLFADIHWSAID